MLAGCSDLPPLYSHVFTENQTVKHGTYIRWYLRTFCARMNEFRSGTQPT